MKEPFLEPILCRMRIKKVLPTIRRYPDCRLLDIGCGWNYCLLKTAAPFIGSGVGIDFKVLDTEGTKIKTMRMVLADSLPFEAESFHVVTMLAVLEHLADPLGMLAAVKRVLKRDGRLVLTIPSRLSRPVLEFLAYYLKIVDAKEIRDHKRYYNCGDIEHILTKTGLIMEEHRYFQLGLNNYCVAVKKR